MATPSKPPIEPQIERAELRTQIIEVLSQRLKLTLAAAELEALLDGETLSFEQLASSRSLAEIGNLCLRLDQLLQTGETDSKPSTPSAESGRDGRLEARRRLRKCTCPEGCRCEGIWPLCITSCPLRPIELYLMPSD